MNTYAIGDVHGCSRALQQLLQTVPIQFGDEIVFLGDYIDRGENSKGVIDQILLLKAEYQVISLRGNHEAMMLDARDNPLSADLWRACGGHETICSYEAEAEEDWVAAIPNSHWDFIETTALCYETPASIFVHGSLDTECPLEEQDQQRVLWDKCHGTQIHPSGRPIICGHTPHTEGRPGSYDWGHCIDTAACRGGWLTCLAVGSGEYWQTNESGEARRAHIDS